MLTAEEILELFHRTGALLEGHFLLSSGLHSTQYLQCALVLQYPLEAERLGRALAENYRHERIATVVSPALGGIIIGHEVARALGARFIWTERENGAMALRRGFSVQPGERILVVEDVVTTGGSTRETMDVLRRTGAEIIAAAAIVDRSGGAVDVGVSHRALLTLKIPTFAAAECPACLRKEPLIKPGSRASAPRPMVTSGDASSVDRQDPSGLR